MIDGQTVILRRLGEARQIRDHGRDAEDLVRLIAIFLVDISELEARPGIFARSRELLALLLLGIVGCLVRDGEVVGEVAFSVVAESETRGQYNVGWIILPLRVSGGFLFWEMIRFPSWRGMTYPVAEVDT